MMTDRSALEELAARSREGDRSAAESLVEQVQDRIYQLALRMLWHPEDARDATQEILIKMLTHLGHFRGDSAFSTWLYRIAANHLLNMRKRRAEEAMTRFDDFGRDLEQGLAEPPSELRVEEHVLLEEVKIGCTHAMLLCLDRPHRLAFILGEILEIDHKEGATVLGISPAAFRKRLSRARESILGFTRRYCGIVDPANPCRCRKRVKTAMRRGRLDPDRLLFADQTKDPQWFQNIANKIQALESSRRAVALYRSHPLRKCPEAFAARVRALVERFEEHNEGEV